MTLTTLEGIHESEIDVILWGPCIGLLEEHTDDVAKYLSAVDTSDGLASYPDGSVVFQGTTLSDGLFLFLAAVQKGMNQTLFWKNTLFRMLLPFPQRRYRIISPIGYFERCREMGPVVIPVPVTPPSDGEMVLDRLVVVVEFVRLPNKMHRERFRQMLDNWERTVASQGCFGEGPMSRIKEEILFDRRMAQFHVDATRSGQQTINWLTLCCLNFGNTVLPVAMISYGKPLSVGEVQVEL